MNSDNSIASLIPNIVHNHISYLYSDKLQFEKVSIIYIALKKLLNGNYEKYDFNDYNFNVEKELSNLEFQNTLSKLNEKQSIRKSNGVYYTPNDVTSFIINNCFKLYQKGNFSKKFLSNDFKDIKISKNNANSFLDLIFNKSIFDPTCGSGEFLIQSLEIKINLLKKIKNKLISEDYINILKTINGNDIDIDSIDIVKIRLFFKVFEKFFDLKDSIKVVDILNENFHCKDFLNFKFQDYKEYDIIVGNPPFVEDKKSSSITLIKFGNIYANVLENSLKILKNNGILGFVIPLSYISTVRMEKIRILIEKNTKYQCLLNYADRPDSLFNSVHQKLSIIFTAKGKGNHKLFTSNYKYWYKSERNQLFSNITLFKNNYLNLPFYPKIGNKLENSIFNKSFTNSEQNIFSISNINYDSKIYLNMRACFWIKAFSFNPGSNEYKAFGFNSEYKHFVLCLLNSSLFFLFWNMVSDCWHITLKELKYFRIPKLILGLKLFSKLSNSLEKELESTKLYIGSKQTEFEYKHKACKNIIDIIDTIIGQSYNLSEEEIEYVKKYALKYRESRGA